MEYIATMTDDPVLSELNEEIDKIIKQRNETLLFIQKQAENSELRFRDLFQDVFGRVVSRCKDLELLADYDHSKQMLSITKKNQLMLSDIAANQPIHGVVLK